MLAIAGSKTDGNGTLVCQTDGRFICQSDDCYSSSNDCSSTFAVRVVSSKMNFTNTCFTNTCKLIIKIENEYLITSCVNTTLFEESFPSVTT